MLTLNSTAGRWPLEVGLLRPAYVDVAMTWRPQVVSQSVLNNWRNVLVPGGIMLLTGLLASFIV
jgi:hypothetical protein